MIKRPTQTKYLSVKDYLEYKDILEKKGFFSDEMNQFMKDHDLPTSHDLSENNLRVYVDSVIPIRIYNMNEIKNVEMNVHLTEN